MVHPLIKAFVFLETHLSIEELAQKVAERLLPANLFGGREHNIRDEFPAVYVRNIIGCMMVLLGDPEIGYNLTLEPQRYPVEKGANVEKVDISVLLAFLLRDLEGVKVSLE